jgi:hypothetical protein
MPTLSGAAVGRSAAVVIVAPTSTAAAISTKAFWIGVERFIGISLAAFCSASWCLRCHRPTFYRHHRTVVYVMKIPPLA